VPFTLLLVCSPALHYDAEQFKRGSEMPKRPDVSAIVEQVIQRLKQIEEQVTHNQGLADELGRLRDAVKDLERAIMSRLSGEQAPAAEPTERGRRQTAGPRSRAATRPRAAKRATAPRGQNQAKILEALKGSEPMTASEVARRTGISTATVSTTLTKMARSGQLTKAERGYKLPS
jgi:predicted Rossmann fold nucleotide-binding protein DprA/Smf involved in DNA uptake